MSTTALSSVLLRCFTLGGHAKLFLVFLKDNKLWLEYKVIW